LTPPGSGSPPALTFLFEQTLSRGFERRPEEHVVLIDNVCRTLNVIGAIAASMGVLHERSVGPDEDVPNSWRSASGTWGVIAELSAWTAYPLRSS